MPPEKRPRGNRRSRVIRSPADQHRNGRGTPEQLARCAGGLPESGLHGANPCASSCASARSKLSTLRSAASDVWVSLSACSIAAFPHETNGVGSTPVHTVPALPSVLRRETRARRGVPLPRPPTRPAARPGRPAAPSPGARTQRASSSGPLAYPRCDRGARSMTAPLECHIAQIASGSRVAGSLKPRLPWFAALGGRRGSAPPVGTDPQAAVRPVPGSDAR